MINGKGENMRVPDLCCFLTSVSLPVLFKQNVANGVFKLLCFQGCKTPGYCRLQAYLKPDMCVRRKSSVLMYP